MLKKFFSFLLESLFPIVLVIIAIVISFQPKIGNFTFDTDAIILSLFSLLAIDSILEKYRTKKRISDKIEIIAKDSSKLNKRTQEISEKVNLIENVEVLKNRSDFERLENIFSRAKNELFISGTNLDGIVPSCSIIKERANSGVKIRLLLLDPDGKRLAASSDMSGVLVSERKKKIRANLDYLKREFQDEITSGKIQLRTIDGVLPFSFIGIDINYGDGLLIVQNYLYKTPSSKSLMLEFTTRQLKWYNLYHEQLELMWSNGISK